MLRIFLFQLLGFWLLLNQPSRARISNEWLDEVIKVCNRQFVRTAIDVCGKISRRRAMLSREEPALRSRRSAKIVPSYINKDADPLNVMLEFIPNLPQEPKAALSERRPLQELQQHVPALKDSNLSFEEFKKSIHNRQGEPEDNSPSELKYLELDTHSRKKREADVSLLNKCCEVGCTRRLIATFC